MDKKRNCSKSQDSRTIKIISLKTKGHRHGAAKKEGLFKNLKATDMEL